PEFGYVDCLDVTTNTFTRFARADGGGFGGGPQDLSINTDGEVFVANRVGSIDFAAYAARTSAQTFVVTPVTRTVVAQVRPELTVTDATLEPTVATVSATETTLSGVDNGSGVVRFALPLSY